MPDRTLDERIAEHLGWKPPGSDACVTTFGDRHRQWKAGNVPGPPPRLSDWLRHDGELRQPPRYTTEPAAMAELLKKCVSVHITELMARTNVALSLDHSRHGTATTETLEAAVAEAFAAAVGITDVARQAACPSETDNMESSGGP